MEKLWNQASVWIGLAGGFLAKRERLLTAAKRAADYLIAGAVPEGAALERFPRTYENGGEYGRFVGEEDRIMLCYPALCGRAFVHLFEATKDGKYLDAARRIAGTYIKLQGEDGTWFLLQNAVTGKEYAPNRLLPTDVLEFFEELHRVDGNDVYRRTADKVFAYIEKGPMSDWNWEGQFEDTRPSSVRWKNLTKHPACATAVYLLKRFPDDAVRLAQAEELVRFAEDQFVEWTAPYVGREETGDADDGSWDHFCLPHSRWMTPCALEQYYCYWPIDASAARLINTYLELWRTTRKHAYLAKARALGAAATRMQEPDGWINTWWIKGVERNDDRYHTWINCMLETALALSNLAKADKEEKTKTVICWGDSITEGMSMKAEDAYPSRLQGLLGEDYKVLNSGDGGENVVTIPARQGALPLKTAAAIAFAAGESKVQIGDGEDNGFRTDDGCRIKLTKPLGRDIPVNPVRIGDGSYRVLLDDFKWNTPGHPISYRLCIERADASAAKEIPAGTPVVFASSSAVKEAYCEVFLMGANGGWDNDIGKLIAGHRRMIARRGADRPYLVVVPYWGGITERQVADFKAAFGDHAVDFRAAAVACGLDPVSLMLRNRPDCHLNAAGYDFLAQQVHERGRALGYW